MRILVGTMHTIEQEFEECVAAIRRQRGCDFEHFVIENKTHLEGHRLLYGAFMARAGEFDIFLKVDADMVIIKDDLFSGIADRFRKNRDMQWLMVAVHDFFPNRLVRGMHAYRNSVKWPVKEEKVFVDECPVSVSQSEVDYDTLAPAALHCPHPSSFQAFHYGASRGIKVAVGLADCWINSECLGFIEDTWRRTKHTTDQRLLLASLGAELALAGILREDHLDHACLLASEPYKQYNGLTSKVLARKISVMRVVNRVRHPALLFKALTLREWLYLLSTVIERKSFSRGLSAMRI